MTQATTTAASPNNKPKRTRAPAGPMTPTKALAAIARIRDKATTDEEKILAQLPEADAARVAKFLES